MNKISKRQMISCGIVVVNKMSGQYKYLLLRCYNYYEPAKGHQEPGETDLETALRETQEETGIKPEELDFKWGKDFISTEPYGNHHKIARFFIAETTRKDIILPINPEIGKAEHDGWGWLNYNEASRVVGARIQAVLDWAKEKIGE